MIVDKRLMWLDGPNLQTVAECRLRALYHMYDRQYTVPRAWFELIQGLNRIAGFQFGRMWGLPWMPMTNDN
jgi:hypothetical protein